MKHRTTLLSLLALAGMSMLALPSVVRADDDKATATAAASDERILDLQVGDKAPEFKVETFVKGDTISGFKAGHVYVVEFWATWCGPCVRAFPHISELQKEYKDKVTVVGVNIWEARGENDYTPETLTKVKDFVAKQGDKMAYTVAYDGNAKHMTNAYMTAAGQNGIPAAFIVDGTGTIAWIGHPMSIDEPLKEIVAGTWDVKAAKADFLKEMRAEVEQARLMKLIEADGKELRPLMQAEKWDEALPVMERMVAKAPSVTGGLALRVLNVHWDKNKNFEKGDAYAANLVDNVYKDDAQILNAIAWTIVDPETPLETPNLDIAMRAAERADTLSKGKEPQVIDTLARVHYMKGNRTKAAELQQKAIDLAPDEMKDSLREALKTYTGT